MSEALLEGRRILLVEDDYFIADAMLDALQSAGATVLGPVSSVSDALALLDREREVDSAILDINLNGEMVFPVADVLTARAIPFLFATGYDEAGVPPAWRHVRRCEKPVDAAAVAGALHSGSVIFGQLPQQQKLRVELGHVRQVAPALDANTTVLR